MTKMTNTSFPQLSEALDGWEFSLLTNKREQTLVDGVISYTDHYIKMRGIIQPLKTEDIALKPEEQRSWAWYQIHVKSKYPVMQNDQVIYINKLPYKIMAKKDYSRNGYVEYHIIENFNESST